MYTPRFDPNRCFAECKEIDIEVQGNWFPWTIFGKFIAMCAYIWMLICAIHVTLFCGSFDYILLDQVSFPIPILWIMNSKVIFYCHYPDKLLCVDWKSFIKRAYRFVLDLFEEITTGFANVILVNSKFTMGVFAWSFTILNKFRRPPQVLYPAI